ncbi:MAG: hypothetical protein V4702_01500 [Patescibacteria group bacterium]
MKKFGRLTPEGGWKHAVLIPSDEFNTTGLMVQELRIQDILDGEEVPDESASALLLRYQRAREIVQSTPVPDDFNVAERLQTAMLEIHGMDQAIQAGFKQHQLQGLLHEVVAIESCRRV